jgi:hypothetical protein
MFALAGRVHHAKGVHAFVTLQLVCVSFNFGGAQVILSLDSVLADHFDPGDESVCAVTWYAPDEVEVFYLYLPNVGERGVAIRLRSGTTIVWDGRYLRHGTTVARDAKGRVMKGVYGMFVCKNSLHRK